MLGEEAVITLHGQGIFGDLSVDLSGEEAASVDASFEVGVGNLVLVDVDYVDSSQVRVTVPRTLELGLHNVRLTIPSREEMILRDALEVVAFLPTADAGSGIADGGMTAADAGMAGAPVTTFSDEFNDGQIDPRWNLLMTPTGCTVSENSDRLHFQMDGGGACRCEVATAQAYDLRGLATSIDIPPITTFFPTMTSYMRITGAGGDSVEYGFNNDNLYISIVESGLETRADLIAYDSSIRYWRIREAAGQLFFESSINLSTWTVEMQETGPFSVANVQVSIGVSTAGPMPQGVGISVYSYNISQ